MKVCYKIHFLNLGNLFQPLKTMHEILCNLYPIQVLSHNSYKFNALFKKSTTFCICFQLELHFLLAHKKLLTFSIRSQLLLLFLRYIKKQLTFSIYIQIFHTFSICSQKVDEFFYAYSKNSKHSQKVNGVFYAFLKIRTFSICSQYTNNFF